MEYSEPVMSQNDAYLSANISCNTSTEFLLSGACVSEHMVTTHRGALLLNYTPLTSVLVGVSLVAVMLLTAIGNFLVGFALIRYRSLRTVSNCLIGNLALSDFLLATTILPLSMVNECLGHWIFGQVTCNLWLIFDVFYCTASIWNICVIAFDRFTATFYPMWYRDKRSAKQAALYVITVWVIAFAISVPPLLGWIDLAQNYKPDRDIDNVWHCTIFQTPSYVLYSASGSFFVPFFITVGLYARVFGVLRERMARSRSTRRSNRRALVHSSSVAPPEGIKEGSPMDKEKLNEEQTELLDWRHRTNGAATTADRDCRGGKSNDVIGASSITEIASSRFRPRTQQLPALDVTAIIIGESSLCRTSHGLDGDGNMSSDGLSPHVKTSDIDTSFITNTAAPLFTAKNSKCEHNVDRLSRGHIATDDSTTIGCNNINSDDQTVTPPMENLSDDIRNGVAAQGIKNDVTKMFLNDGSKFEMKRDLLTFPSRGSHVPARSASAREGMASLTVIRDEAGRPVSPRQHYQVRRVRSACEPGWSGGGAGLRGSMRRLMRRASLVDALKSVGSIKRLQACWTARQHNFEQVEMKATIRMAFIVISVCCMWLGFFVFYVINGWCGAICPQIPHQLDALFFWLGYLNSTVNPILYAIFNEDFRRAFRKILGCEKLKDNFKRSTAANRASTIKD